MKQKRYEIFQIPFECHFDNIYAWILLKWVNIQRFKNKYEDKIKRIDNELKSITKYKPNKKRGTNSKKNIALKYKKSYPESNTV